MKSLHNLTSKVLLFVLIAILSPVKSSAMTIDEVPNVNKQNRTHYVSDPAGLMDPAVRSMVDSRLWQLRNQTSVEPAVVIVPTTGDVDIDTWSVDLFEKWGLGKGDNDNGVLLVIATDDHNARITTGYGVEGPLPDISCAKIIRHDIAPYMRQGDINGAVDHATATIAAALTDPAVAEELKSKKKDNYDNLDTDITTDTILKVFGFVAFIVFLISGALYISDSRMKGRSDHTRAATLLAHRNTYLGLTILSAGLGIIWLLLARNKERRLRNKPVICDNCGATMHKLDEETDNQYLSASQDLEEELGTVDYDVWLCPECNNTEIFPYVQDQKKYSKCPKCQTLAMTLVLDKTVVPATTRHPGKGVKIYECKYCGNRSQTTYTIPQKENTAAIAAGLAAGALSSGRGGGGSFGGGFGGGHTGGGGASGGW